MRKLIGVTFKFLFTVLPACAQYDPGCRFETVVPGPFPSSTLALDGAGRFVVGNPITSQILAVAPDGTKTVLAGTGQAGFSGDHGPALSAQFAHPSGAILGKSGEIYVADTGNNRVRKIEANGQVTTIAGSGSTAEPSKTPGKPPQPTSPLEFPLYRPSALSMDSRGTFTSKFVLRLATTCSR